MKFVLVLVSILLLVSCSSPIPPNTGVEGEVSIGPTCPVVQLNNPCPDQPYQATLTVLNSSQKKVTQFETDADGAFHVPLAPGEYILRPESPNVMPIAPEQTFIVVAGQFTQLTVTYDSGIR